MAGWVEGIRRALILGLVLIAGTAIEQALSVGSQHITLAIIIMLCSFLSLGVACCVVMLCCYVVLLCSVVRVGVGGMVWCENTGLLVCNDVV